jgi:hypothetical protein
MPGSGANLHWHGLRLRKINPAVVFAKIRLAQNRPIRSHECVGSSVRYFHECVYLLGSAGTGGNLGIDVFLTVRS